MRLPNNCGSSRNSGTRFRIYVTSGMIQFDYEVHSYFGNHVKVVIEDNILRYRSFIVEYGTSNDWITPEVSEQKIAVFLESLESLEGCIEDYRNDSRLEGVEYSIYCHTDNIKKSIRGYHEYQSTVKEILSALPKMDEGLKSALDLR